MQTRQQYVRRSVALTVFTIIVILPTILFWDTSGNLPARILVGGVCILLACGFVASSIIELRRQRTKRD